MPRRPPTVAGPRVRADPALHEAVVELLLGGPAAGGPPSQRFRRAADRLYGLYPSPEDRHAAFASLHARLFEELGCAGVLAEALAGWGGRVEEVLVTRAWSPEEEGAELGTDRRSVGLRIRPGRFTAREELRRFLRHELEHVADMFDPAFAYGDGAVRTGERLLPLVGARFGCLWDCSVDGRIQRAGGSPLYGREELQRRCAAFFPGLSPEAVEKVVHRLWEGVRPTYPALVTWARRPETLASWVGEAPVHEGDTGPQPGTPCPLCGFATYAWAGPLDEATAALLRQDFPAWRSGDGACARCVELYEVRSRALAGVTAGRGRAAEEV